MGHFFDLQFISGDSGDDAVPLLDIGSYHVQIKKMPHPQATAI